jgi:hypothetical protein
MSDLGHFTLRQVNPAILAQQSAQSPVGSDFMRALLPPEKRPGQGAGNSSDVKRKYINLRQGIMQCFSPHCMPVSYTHRFETQTKDETSPKQTFFTNIWSSIFKSKDTKETKGKKQGASECLSPQCSPNRYLRPIHDAKLQEVMDNWKGPGDPCAFRHQWPVLPIRTDHGVTCTFKLCMLGTEACDALIYFIKWF